MNFLGLKDYEWLGLLVVICGFVLTISAIFQLILSVILIVTEGIKKNGGKKMKNENLVTVDNGDAGFNHPMLGKYCIIRTYSAGVHIGVVAWVAPHNSMEVKLTDAIRLWSWSDGGLSLSAVANNGIKGGRINITGEVYLTNAIEYIPVSEKAKATFDAFIED